MATALNALIRPSEDIALYRAEMAEWLQWLSDALPLVYAYDALARVSSGGGYGGRFVQAIEGIAGSLSKREDWFYFVNGLEADRGAVEYRLRPGDVEWWDYRHWSDPAEKQTP